MNHGSFPTTVQYIHNYPSDLTHESRIFSIARTKCIEIWRAPLEEAKVPGRKIRKLIKYVHWLSRIISRYAKQPLKIINCHRIFDLPAREAQR